MAQKPSHWVSFASNLAFDLGGILTPLTVWGTDRSNAVVFVGCEGLTVLYGLGCVADGGLLISGH